MQSDCKKIHHQPGLNDKRRTREEWKSKNSKNTKDTKDTERHREPEGTYPESLATHSFPFAVEKCLWMGKYLHLLGGCDKCLCKSERHTKRMYF